MIFDSLLLNKILGYLSVFDASRTMAVCRDFADMYHTMYPDNEVLSECGMYLYRGFVYEKEGKNKWRMWTVENDRINIMIDEPPKIASFHRMTSTNGNIYVESNNGWFVLKPNYSEKYTYYEFVGINSECIPMPDSRVSWLKDNSKELIFDYTITQKILCIQNNDDNNKYDSHRFTKTDRSTQTIRRLIDKTIGGLSGCVYRFYIDKEYINDIDDGYLLKNPELSAAVICVESTIPHQTIN